MTVWVRKIFLKFTWRVYHLFMENHMTTLCLRPGDSWEWKFNWFIFNGNAIWVITLWLMWSIKIFEGVHCVSIVCLKIVLIFPDSRFSNSHAVWWGLSHFDWGQSIFLWGGRIKATLIMNYDFNGWNMKRHNLKSQWKDRQDLFEKRIQAKCEFKQGVLLKLT